jgi:hypothetical protein
LLRSTVDCLGWLVCWFTVCSAVGSRSGSLLILVRSVGFVYGSRVAVGSLGSLFTVVRCSHGSVLVLPAFVVRSLVYWFFLGSWLVGSGWFTLRFGFGWFLVCSVGFDAVGAGFCHGFINSIVSVLSVVVLRYRYVDFTLLLFVRSVRLLVGCSLRYCICISMPVGSLVEVLSLVGYVPVYVVWFWLVLVYHVWFGFCRFGYCCSSLVLQF